MENHDVPVLIVGGSLVGLSTAVFLGHHGVPSLVVERHRGTAIHPRAALVNQRAMEAYRAVGLEDEVEEAAAREFVQNGAIVSVESLGGKELDWYFRTINEGVEDISPSARLFVTQIGLEPVLLRAAKRLGARVEHASEAVSVEQDAEGVTVVVRPRDGRCRANRASPLRDRSRRRPQPDPRAARDSRPRPRELLRQHHDLLQGRRPPADGRSQPQRDLRLRAPAAGVLPLLDRSAGGLPRGELDRPTRRERDRSESART